MAPHDWHTIATPDVPALRSFLTNHEPEAVVLSDKLRAGTLDRKLRHGGRFYLLPGRAAVFHGPGGFFYPVGVAEAHAHGETRGLKRVLGNFLRLHSIMGTTDDAEALEEVVGTRAGRVIDYDLMILRYRARISQPHGTAVASRPVTAARPDPELRVERAEPVDWRRLLALQMAYETEEVLLPGRQPNPAVSRSILLESLRTQRVLIATYRNQIVGRVATNARGYRGDQIGGVYTDPAWRGRGVATWLMSHLIAEIARDERDASLFVKRSNPAAQALYRSLQFDVVSDFQISYFL